MPLPAWVARLNRRVTNRVTRPFAAWVPGFAVVSHTGRRTGRRYLTPVNLFRSGEEYVIALTYGADRDWVRNVSAAGGCELQTRGTAITVEEPRIVTDPALRPIPSAVRTLLRAMKVTQLLYLRPAGNAADRPSGSSKTPSEQA